SWPALPNKSGNAEEHLCTFTCRRCCTSEGDLNYPFLLGSPFNQSPRSIPGCDGFFQCGAARIAWPSGERSRARSRSIENAGKYRQRLSGNGASLSKFIEE